MRATAAAARGLPSLLFTARHEVGVLTAGGDAATYAVGLAARARDTMGTPTAAEALVAEGEVVEEGAALVRICWSGVIDSASDELYHSRWDVVNGETVVRAPLAGVAEALNAELLSAPRCLDELAVGTNDEDETTGDEVEPRTAPDDAWLLRVRSDPAAVGAALRAGSAMRAADYASMLWQEEQAAEAAEGSHTSY